jgi:16S rRNA (guanine1207-N2)-methyltransferase
MNDPVLDTLMLALNDGYVTSVPQPKTLFLRARFGYALSDLARENIICEQGFKPEHDRLRTAGFTVSSQVDGADNDLCLVLPPRQRDEGRALLARAVAQTKDGGTVLACVANLEGAKTVENDLKSLLGEVCALSKNKCRAFWGTVDATKMDHARLKAWQFLDAPRMCDNGFLSRPGLFSWDRVDKGSKLLADHLAPLSGIGADLGCGYGYLMAEVLAKNASVTRLDGFEAEARAVEVARENTQKFEDRAKVIWADVCADELGLYDFVVSNPPFHTDRADRHELGQAFIAAAAKALKKGGTFHMVANRHLPYEATLKSAFKTVSAAFEGDGYKIYRAVKG